MATRTEFIAAYLRTCDSSNDGDFWAYQAMHELYTTNPKEAIKMTFELIDACESDAQLAYIAAGALEDLLWSGNQSNFSIFASACKQSPKTLRAMSMLGWAEEDPMYSPWKALLAEHGIGEHGDA